MYRCSLNLGSNRQIMTKNAVPKNMYINIAYHIIRDLRHNPIPNATVKAEQKIPINLLMISDSTDRKGDVIRTEGILKAIERIIPPNIKNIPSGRTNFLYADCGD